MATNSTIADPWVRHFGALSYALLSGGSICANIMLACTFFYGRKHFQRTAFYAIAWQLVVCDLIAQFIQLGIAVPITFTGEQIYGDVFPLYAVLFFDTIAYNGTLYFSALMTLSRLMVFFCHEDVYHRIFSGIGQFCLITFVWAFVSAFVICLNLIGCRKAFSETGFYLYHECKPAEEISGFGMTLRKFSTLMSTYLPVVMLVAYLVLFGYIRYTHWLVQRRARQPHYDMAERMRTRQRERAFLFQSFVICGFLWVQNLAFCAVPYFPDVGQASFFINFAENWIQIALNSMGPLTLFLCNTEVRRCAHELYCPWKHITAGSTIAPAGTPAIRRSLPLAAPAGAPALFFIRRSLPVQIAPQKF